MKVIIKYIKIYKTFWSFGLLQTLFYRFDSLMLFLGVSAFLLSNIAFISSTFSLVSNISGWTLAEATFLLAIHTFNWGIFKIFYHKRMEETIDEIFRGQHDFRLLKPVSARFISFFLPPYFKSIPVFLLGIALLIFSTKSVALFLTTQYILAFILAEVCAHVITFAFFQIPVAMAFFSGQSMEAFGIVENAWEYGKYPSGIFSGNVLKFLTFIIPITLFASYPSAILLGKVPLNISTVLIPVCAAVLSLTLSNMFYKFGLKNYTSASS